jgi:hypothetical protein
MSCLDVFLAFNMILEVEDKQVRVRMLCARTERARAQRKISRVHARSMRVHTL